jgi:DNA primase
VDEVDQIKERLDIVEVISSYLTLKKAGANLKTNCPFHTEKTPSFMVSPERQTFRCFGCNTGGDVFTFIEKMEGIDFYNALKLLADRAGVKLESRSIRRGEQEYKSDIKTKVYEINDWTKKLYHKILLDHPKAEHARKYLEGRGMRPKTIADFELGYAPESWELLIKFLGKKKYSREEIIKAGVAIRNDRGEIYDRFRSRIIFPISNIMGQTVAFTSRILKDDGKSAKYINSAESPIYIKGKTVYGLDRAKMAIKEADNAIFVEGNMDVIACHQAGFKNVVATSGTAITEEQLKILSRYTSLISFSFDSDEAGAAAMKKAICLALKNDIASKIVALRAPFKDADEAIKSDPKNWIKAVEGAKPSLEFWIDLLISKSPDLGVIAKRKIAKEILPVIKTIYSDIEKEYYIKYLAQKLSVSEKALISALEKTAGDREISNARKEEGEQLPKISLLQKIMTFIWIKPELISQIKEELVVKYDQNLPDFSAQIAKKEIVKDKLNSKEADLLNQYEIVLQNDYDFSDEDEVIKEFQFLLKIIESEKNDHIKAQYAVKIQTAEAKGDREELKRLLSEFSALIK